MFCSWKTPGLYHSLMAETEPDGATTTKDLDFLDVRSP